MYFGENYLACTATLLRKVSNDSHDLVVSVLVVVLISIEI